MHKDLSRRKFLEQVGLGTAAGVSLSLFNDVAEARPQASRRSLLELSGEPAPKSPSWRLDAEAAF